MKRSYLVSGIGIAVVAAALFGVVKTPSTAIAQQKPKRTVSGLVLDKDGKAVRGAMVYLVEIGGTTTPDSTTDNAGKYEFKQVALGESFDVVFSHTQYETALVSRLAPAGDQVIHKTLYRPGEKKLAVSDILDRLHTLERLSYYLGTKVEENKDLREVLVKELREKPNTKLYSASDTAEYAELPAARRTKLTKMVESRVAALAMLWQ